MGDNGTQQWLEGELRRMLGFNEVEEIVRFAFESFSVSQTVELRQYLEQFLGQSKEVEKLCNELEARRAGRKSKPSTWKSSSDDFWGGGKSSSVAQSSLALSGGAGQQPKGVDQGKRKAKGKLYQKAAAEDFWGGGTTSGASGNSKKAAAPKTPSSRDPAPAPLTAATRPPPATATAESVLGAATPKTEPTSSKSASKIKRGAPTPGGARMDPGRALPAAVGKKGKQGKASMGAGGMQGGAPELRPGVTPTVDEPTPEWSGVTCLCMAMRHDLLTNCTSCGKIACVNEGGFGCSFCGSALPVTGREPRKVGDPKIGGRGRGDGGSQQSEALKEALARKEKLLLFDRTSASRTRVLDDQGDYFTSHNWLSQKEREKGEAEEKARRENEALQRGSRRQVKLSIDIMGRRVIETRSEGGVEDDQDGGPEAAVVEGISLDLGATSRPSGAGSSSGVGKGEAADRTVITENISIGSEARKDQRRSLENTGLRGRAKEVYDVMRANLEKEGRRQVGGKGKAGKSSGTVADISRLSLWRVQHDVTPKDN